ncbi:flagellar hook-associated protein FlgK [Shewanella sp. UCD-FRSSP16_17]|uniref:flagellar hook-associated protein FlgK n=1 Tax=unclassified Shewanella TaxID=196818 RepID=UPI0007EEA29E|nr:MULTISPECIES: flagellar hook-associated protein FlgK [unclassified Shewanella]MBQ4891147.1 flagellar hook-associated protein FlgK [Shewanella sp. MMG014]OBT10348.1 flagellar hook-associated protein FlgK [Shewanella sp. UCD-FRSSP16_17]
MAVDLLNIARTGVLAAQSQMGVTSNNIANANTIGYHRQVAEQSSLESQKIGNSFYGTGTYVTDVKRIYNDFAARELRIGQTSMSAAETRYTKMNEMDQLYSQIGSMVPDRLNDFFSSINSVADLPTDIGMRDSMLGAAQQAASSLNQMQSHLDSQMKQTNSQIGAMADRINEISNELASINLELMKSESPDSQLLDKQDALILELSEYSEVNVIPLENGAKSVMLGGSVMLVSGEVSMQIGTTTGDPYPNESRLTTTTGNQSLVIDGSKLGGQLGELFKFRDETLVPVGQELGQLALGIADAFNEMQSNGYDLNGEIGQNIFTDINDPLMSAGRVGEFDGNTGTAKIRVNIDDVGELTGSSYELSFTAPSTYELKDTKTGEVQALTYDAVNNQLTGGDGFSIQIDSVPAGFADGDKFEIRPNAGAAAGIGVEMTDPKGIAAAAPKITGEPTNSGDTSVKLTSIDRANANFPVTDSEITIQIDTVTNTYQAFDASGAAIGGPTAFTPPQISTPYGFDFEISDTSTAGVTDSYTFDLSFAEGDNSNAIEMAKLSDEKLMNGGTTTLAGVFEGSKLDIASKTKAAAVSFESNEAVYLQAYNRVQSESGVNLDEEAANLMRYQQSYQASARIMTTAQQMFDSLLSSVR